MCMQLFVEAQFQTRILSRDQRDEQYNKDKKNTRCQYQSNYYYLRNIFMSFIDSIQVAPAYTTKKLSKLDNKGEGRIKITSERPTKFEKYWS